MRILPYATTAIALFCATAAHAADDAPATQPAALAPATQPARTSMRGIISKVDPTSITIRVDAAGTERTLAIQENTVVMVGTVFGERTDDRGNAIRSVGTRRGSSSDLKVDDRVIVQADHDVAVAITSVPPLAVSRDGTPIDGFTLGPATAPAPLARGIISTVDPMSITIKDAAGTEKTFAIDENTRIMIPQVADRADPNGSQIRSIRFGQGTSSDLQPGQRVSINADHDVAMRINVAVSARGAAGPMLDGGFGFARATTRPNALDGTTRPAAFRPLMGRITKLDAGSITVDLRNGSSTTQPGERTYKINENTRVLLGVVVNSRQDIKGRTLRSVTGNSATAADLQVGQDISFRADGDNFQYIMIMPAGGLVLPRGAPTTAP